MKQFESSRRLLALLVTGSLLATGPTAAQVYTWTDEDGVVHYADMPDGDDAEMVAIKSRRTDPEQIAEEVSEDRARRAVESAAAREQAEIEAEERAIDAQNEAARADACKRAQAAVGNYTNNRRFYKPLPDGERAWLTDEEVAEAQAAAGQAVERYCD